MKMKSSTCGLNTGLLAVQGKNASKPVMGRGKALLKKVSVALLFFLMLGAPKTVLGQVAASLNYVTQSGNLGTTYSWIDCSSGTNIVSGDDAQGTISWPFNFKFYDTQYTTANVLSVATNGFIRLDGLANTAYASATGYNLTSTATELGQIVALGIWDNNVGGISSSWVRSSVTGTAPYRVFTIEYQDLEIDYNDNKYADIQVSFYETTNKIVLKLGSGNIKPNLSGIDMGLHSGVNGYFHKWRELNTGTYNAWIEYTPNNFEVNATIGTTLAYYTSLKAVFDNINNGLHRGTVTVKIRNSSVETATAVLNASGTGGSSFASVRIYPTLANLSVVGNLTAPLIDLNGADNVTIDGRVNAVGTAKSLQISNTSTSGIAGTSTLRLINAANNNVIRYCTIQGATTNTTSGVVFLATSTAVGGNQDNTIDNNNITNAGDANRPVNAIYSSGTAGKENTATFITNNNIYDVLNRTTTSNAISLASNTTSFTITGNSLYETTSFSSSTSVAYNGIVINNTTGNSFVIADNFIGGKAALCGGTAWTKTNTSNNTFNAISVSVGTAAASSIQNNTIRNFNWGNSGSAPWTAIAVGAGTVNVGTTAGNTIGSSTGTASITVTAGSTGAMVYGIYINSPAAVDCQNNTIGSLTASNAAANATHLYGIYKTATTGTTTLSNNTIGSVTTSNSLNTSAVSSANAQQLYGIYNAGTGLIHITGNTIANLRNGTTNSTAATTGLIGGIYAENGTNTIAGNSIFNLTIANANNNALHLAAVTGIALTGTTTVRNINNNTIYNLTNTFTNFTGHVTGLFVTGTSGANNSVESNFIHSLGAESGTLNGIKIGSGTGTYVNNIISLGGTKPTTIIGIFDTAAASQNTKLYFNTVHINGTGSTGAASSYGLYVNANSSARDYRNNIFSNGRSNTGASGKHYAIFYAATGGSITVNYNDYYTSGVGGMLGYHGADRSTLSLLKSATSQDANSLDLQPVFAVVGGTNAMDYKTATTLVGDNSTGIIIDYEGATRLSVPQMGAFSRLTSYIWTGNTSTNFNTASNWESGIVPPNGVDILFAANPVRHCVLDQNRSFKNIYNAQGIYWLVLNGKTLTVTGNIFFSNNAKIDATATGSVLLLAGTTAQNLPLGGFVSNTLTGLNVNNNAGVNLTENLTLTEALILTNGALNIGVNTLTINGSISRTSGTMPGGSSSNIVINGSGSQTVLPAITLNNLTLNRASGLSLGGNVSVLGTLTLTSGTLTVGANHFILSGNAPVRVSGFIDASNTGAGISFTSPSAVTLPASLFTAAVQNLTVNGGGITLSNDLTVNGILNLLSANPSGTKGSLETGSYTLHMGATASTTGIGDVTGKIRRTSILPNIEYTFGNQFTSVLFANIGTLPSEITLKVVIGVVPSWKPDGIRRVYDIAQKDAVGTSATIKAHYLNTELNGNDEMSLSNFSYIIPSATLLDRGVTELNTDENWISLNNTNFGNLPSVFGVMEHGFGVSFTGIITWNGSKNTDWYDAANWTPAYAPSSDKTVIVPDATTTPRSPFLSDGSNSTIKSLNIHTGGVLTAGLNTQLTLVGAAGAWTNYGVFNPGTSTIVFNHGVVDEIATIAGTTNFYNIEVGPNSSLQPVAGNLLRIAGIGRADSSSVVDFSNVNNTVSWNGGDQFIVNPTGFAGKTGYHHLMLEGSGIKTMQDTPTRINGEFHVMGSATVMAQSALTILDYMHIDVSATFITGAFEHMVAGNLDIDGNFIASAGSHIHMNGTNAPQSIFGEVPAVFEKLTLNNPHGVNLYQNVVVKDTLALTAGNLNVENTTLSIDGVLTRESGLLELNAQSSLTFGGTTPLVVDNGTFAFPPPSFKNLTINRTGGVTLNSDATINGVLHLQSANPSAVKGTLDTGVNTLNMGANAITTGQGDVTGKVRRTALLPNIEYTFGHQFTSVMFANTGTLPSEVTLKITIGSAPTWNTGGISRVYDITQVGASQTRGTIKAHYLDAELNGNNEINISNFSYIIPTATLLDRGLTELNTMENWVSLNNADFGNLPSVFGVMEHGFGISTSDLITWDGSESTDWFEPTNWTPAHIPDASVGVVIPHAATTPRSPVIANSGVTTVKTLNIQSGGVLTAGNGVQLTITGASGAWQNTGTFNAGTSTVILNHGIPSEIATISGTTDFYHIKVGPNTTVQPVVNATVRIAGVGEAEESSVVDFSSINNTVSWNGTDQIIVNPIGLSGNSGYYNLILSGSGTKTMPDTPMIIKGNFSMFGTATATASERIQVNGDVRINTGTTFSPAHFNHTVKGHFRNDGTLLAPTDSRFTFNGTMVQNITGAAVSTFYNLTVNNSSGLLQSSAMNVTNELNLYNGNLKVENTTLGIDGTIVKSSGYLEVDSTTSLNFGGSTPLTFNHDLFSVMPSINHLTINRSGGVTLGNQNMRVNGLLNLNQGTLTIAANTLTLGGGLLRATGKIDGSHEEATIAFVNTSPLVLPQAVFTANLNKLTINGAGGVTAGDPMFLNKELNLLAANPTAFKGSLDMLHHTLHMAENATTTGIGDVTGIVRREHPFSNGVEYSFGNPFTNILFLTAPGGTKPSWIECKITIGTAPSWRAEALKRHYSFAQSGGTDRMIVKLHYLDSELHGTETDESQLVFWDAYNPDRLTPNSFTHKYPRSYNDRNPNQNYIQLNGPAINYLATSEVLDVKQWGLSYTNLLDDIHIWTGNGSPTFDGDWSLPGNWNGGVPGKDCNVLIPNPADLPSDNNGDLHPYVNLLPELSPAVAGTLKIATGASLDASTYDITIYGNAAAWVNNGTFIPGSSMVTFAHGDPDNAVELAGTTNFFNLIVKDKTWIQPVAGSAIRIENELGYQSGSILDFTSHNTTLEYAGTNQTVINPLGGAGGYYHLTLSGSGTKTLPNLPFNILGSLTVKNNATATTVSDLALGANLLVSDTAKLNIGAGKKMTVSGSLSNTAGTSGLTLKSNATGTASLIHHSNNVPATVERYITGAKEDWHFLASPVSNQAIAGSAWVPIGSYGNGTGYDMYVWDESGICWVYQLNTTTVPHWPGVHPQTNFVPGRGYLYALQELNPTKSFAGNLNNGIINYPVTANGASDPLLKGFNLVGNPYPSSIDWKAAVGWNRSNLMESGGGYDMWIWNPAANNYGVFNSMGTVGTNEVTQYIAPMQGFFIRATANGSFGMTNEVRVHEGASNWMRTAHSKARPLPPLKVRIDSKSGLGFDEVLMQFGTSQELPGTAKLRSTKKTAPSVYLPFQEKEYSVRFMTDTIQNPSVPLKFEAGADGNYTLSLAVDFGAFATVVLEDKKLKTTQNLLENPVYHFNARVKDAADRFVIHFKQAALTAEELPIHVYYDGNDIVIDVSKIQEESTVVLYDLLGRNLMTKKLPGNRLHHLKVPSKGQVFVVKVSSGNLTINQKLIVY